MRIEDCCVWCIVYALENVWLSLGLSDLHTTVYMCCSLISISPICCIRQQNISRTHYNNTPRTNEPTNKHSTTNKTLMHKHLSLQNSTLTYSRRHLRMNVITFETCWAIKYFHKVTSSWFNYSTMKTYVRISHNLHATVNVTFIALCICLNNKMVNSCWLSKHLHTHCMKH